MAIVINLVIVVLILGLIWALTSEGLWGAALMFFNVLFGGLVAFNFYEPLAQLIDSTGIGWGFSDTLCLLGLFIATTLMLRLTTETLAPAMVRFPMPIYHLGRLFFGVLGSLVTVSILILGLETAPVHKKILGMIDYKTKVPFGLGLDRYWLAFFQQATGRVFVTHVPSQRDPFREFSDAKVFDARGEWLLRHQEARPYGTESILESEGGAEGGQKDGAAGGGAAPATPGAGGMPGAPGPGSMPGRPGPGASAPGDPKVIGPAVGGGVVIQGGPM